MGSSLSAQKNRASLRAAAMENPVSSFDALNWLGRVSVHQDFFWFFSLLFWSVATILWWRHPERRGVWSWLPGVAFAAAGTAMVQFGMFNPTLDIFQDRLVPGTVGNYRPAAVDPYWLADVLMGALLAAMAAVWFWRAAVARGHASLRWVAVGVMAASALLHAADPAVGPVIIAVLALVAAVAVAPLTRGSLAARAALVIAAVAPVASSVGPVAAAVNLLQRSGPPTPFGLATAGYQLLLGLFVLLSLARGLSARLPAETRAAFKRDRRLYAVIVTVLLVTGIIWAIQTGRDNRLEIQQNRLRTAAAHARVFEPALLAPLQSPDFTIDVKSPAGESAPAHSAWLATGIAEPARRRLAEVVIATPFLDHARILVIRDGWLVAALSSAQDSRTGEVEVIRRATLADFQQWERREPYVEVSPVPEIGYAYYCRAPIIGPDGKMLGWLDCVRREYYLSVERRWRAAPFLMTALGAVLLTLLFVQRQIAREREIAMRTAAVAAEGNRIKTAFLANVSHELRTPLQSILGYSELLRQELGAAHQPRLEALRQQGELMTRLVNDLIDLSALESGSFQLAVRTVSPATIVRQTVDTLQPRARGKGLILTCEVAHDVPAWASIDGDRLRQVVTNLVSNALKFTDQGSVSVRLHTTARETRGVTLSVAVRDTGPGISAEQQGQLFKPFTRLARTANKEGSGLGLALSAALCRAMGGEIRLESDGRHGSCFTATVDAALAGAPVAAAAEAMPAIGAATLRVLVVDDNPLVRELFVTALAERGAQCRAAGSGEEALQQLRTEAPDAIVLDLALPDGDGTDFVARFRAVAPGARIIGASAHAGVADRTRALAAGMHAFLVKPVPLDELWSAVAGPAAGAGPWPATSPSVSQELLAAFARELPAKRAALAQAVAAADWPRVRAQAHYLRNSALVVQAGALYAACTGLEEAATAGRAEDARTWWERCAPLLEDLPA
jgi:signal transduction histidine kinase/DNA-binding NarL/FixJ family response regulator